MKAREMPVLEIERTIANFPRRDAADKLRGKTKYTNDRMDASTLHAALLRSAIPAGRIVRLDLPRALKMPGVRAAATSEDAPGLFGIGIADHPLLASGVVRFIGEPIAAIAADTLEQARSAIAAIELELEPMAPILTMDEALRPGARLVHEKWRDYEILFEGAERRGNVAWEAKVVRGDVDAAFARADVTIVESIFRVGRQNHVPF
jgi:CO/xanthine dehydrogenase Mo-binding subunit